MEVCLVTSRDLSLVPSAGSVEWHGLCCLSGWFGLIVCEGQACGGADSGTC